MIKHAKFSSVLSLMPKKATGKRASAKKASKRSREDVQPCSDEEIDVPVPKKLKRDMRSKNVGAANPLVQLFDSYASADSMDLDDLQERSIGPNGIQKMCDDIGISTDDISLLIMAWHLGVERMGYFSLEEWHKLPNYGIIDFQTLKQKVPKFRDDLNDMHNLRRLFYFTFNFAKESSESKVIPVDLAEAYIRLILPDNVHTDPFCKFLQKQSLDPKGYRAINFDQWKMWFEFAHSIPLDFSTYDEESAWPLLIDLYVTYQKDLQKEAAAIMS